MTPAELRSLTFSFRAARAVMAAVHTGVVDAIAGGPRDAEQVAASCGLAPRGARALLEALSALGLVEREGAGYRAAPVLSGSLGEEADAGRRHVVLHDLWHWGLWTRLEESLRSGQPIGDRKGDPFFADPAILVRFFPNLAEAMLETSGRQALQYAERITLAPGARMLDLGGGAGGFVLAVARAHPEAELTLLDLPPVAARAEAAVHAAGQGGRIQVTAADFRSAPLDPDGRGYDRILLARVLMGMEDEAAASLLGRARAALRPGGRVDLLELRREGRVGALLDLDMLLLTGGAVRSRQELAALAARAGLRPGRQGRLDDGWIHLELEASA